MIIRGCPNVCIRPADTVKIYDYLNLCFSCTFIVLDPNTKLDLQASRNSDEPRKWPTSSYLWHHGNYGSDNHIHDIPLPDLDTLLQC